MKKMKLTLTMIALVMGIGGAVATHAEKVRSGTAVYYVDADGNPTQEVSGLPDCISNPAVCAQGFNLDEVGNPTTPTGSDITHGTKR